MPPVVRSAGQLTAIETGGAFAGAAARITSNVALYQGRRSTYADIVRHQPNVRTVISFLARNIAQLGIGLYERADETDRVRVRDHALTAALSHPNPADRRATRYRLIHNLVWDLGAFDAAFWYIIGDTSAGRPAIIRVRPDRVGITGSLWPTAYTYHGARGEVALDPARVVHFQASLNLDDPLWGVSPIESLRRQLAEDDAAGRYRESFWSNGARISGVIERPVAAPVWGEPARNRFKSDWQSLYSGEGAGGTPVLEDGMTWKEAGGVDARSAQYVEARKLSREECAAAYHVDPIWVGVGQAGMSFASVRERHKALYQDTLGPWVTMIEEDFTAQVVPIFEPDEELASRLYVKLNTAEKLRGTFEDVADSISKLVGRPVLTANEGRSLLERNALPEGDGLVTPLNVLVGGQTVPGEAPVTTATASQPPSRPGKALLPTVARRDQLRASHEAAHRRLLERTFDRQRVAVLSAIGAGAVPADLLKLPRWDRELAADLLQVGRAAAAAYAAAYAAALDFDDLDLEVMEPFLARNAELAAGGINLATATELGAALDGAEDPLATASELFAGVIAARVGVIAATRVTSLAGFAAADTARQAGRRSKVWQVTSTKSRHPQLDGETVPIGEPFSNGGQWPGDPSLGADETAGCTCILGFE